MNNTITEMKNTLERISSRITETEEQISELEDRITEAKEQISELEDRMVGITAMEQNKVKRNEDSLRDFWDNVKCTNI